MVLMMLDQGVIRPCNSTFSFNPVVVKKPGQVNKFRFTINYKPLNDKIVPVSQIVLFPKTLSVRNFGQHSTFKAKIPDLNRPVKCFSPD